MKYSMLTFLFLASVAVAALLPFQESEVYRSTINWGEWPNARNQTVFESVRLTFPDQPGLVWVVSYLRGLDTRGEPIANEINAQLLLPADLVSSGTQPVPDLVPGSDPVEGYFLGKEPK